MVGREYSYVHALPLVKSSQQPNNHPEVSKLSWSSDGRTGKTLCFPFTPQHPLAVRVTMASPNEFLAFYWLLPDTIPLCPSLRDVHHNAPSHPGNAEAKKCLCFQFNIFFQKPLPIKSTCDIEQGPRATNINWLVSTTEQGPGVGCSSPTATKISLMICTQSANLFAFRMSSRPCSRMTRTPSEMSVCRRAFNHVAPEKQKHVRGLSQISLARYLLSLLRKCFRTVS